MDIFNATNTTEWIDGNQTSYFLIGEDGITHGEVVVTPPSTGSPGNYTARLRLYDVNGTLVDEDWTEGFFLNLLDVPIANFVYTPENPTDIETITFDAEHHSYPSAPENGSNTSKIVNYTWDFGDGSHEYGGIVTHRYADDGYYNVTLTIIDSNGKNASITKQIYVRNVPPEVNFTIEPSQIVTVGENVYFNSTIYEPDGYIVSYRWDFGDGNFSFTRNATHIYRRSGNYTVKFTVKDDDHAIGTKEKTIWVFDGFVDDDYPKDDPANRRWKSIQNAINDLGNNSMIYVYNGTYNESLIINKTIKLYGEDNRGVIISSDNVVIDVLSNGSLEIHNFTIRDGLTGTRIVNAKLGSVISNCIFYNKNGITIYNTSCNEIENCYMYNGDTGIKITDSEDNLIENCIINGMNDGIYVERSSYNAIRKCSMKHNSNSIYLYNSDKNVIDQCYIEVKNQFSIILPPSNSGIKIVQSNDNTIAVCNISNATSYGVYLASSSRNHINLCNFYENGYGVYLVASSENKISSCNFINNTGPGVTIDSASTNNSIFYNNFILNGVTREDIIQAYDAGRDNRWYKATYRTILTNSSFGEGNFWFDYTGNDANDDGVGDTPYNISGPSRSQDLYPLVDGCKWDEWFGINWGSRDEPWVEAPAPEFYLN
ncbi:MAG: PKD domain-containing protein [Thermoplasmata archaeon]|nr:MAG: PKD domain-containing protein [Thermoplasmata archaeon]